MATMDSDVMDDKDGSLSLPENFKTIPITALRISVRKVTALYLDDPSDIVDEESGLVNDYNGLAELIGFNYLEIKSFSRQKSPTKELLEEWETREHMKPTIGNLWLYLTQLSRFDVMKDCRLAIIKDVEAYLRNKERQQDQYLPLQSDTVSQSSDFDKAPDQHLNETLILCKDDVENNMPQYFDAFVCYNPEGQDLQFVMNMIKILEGPEHNMKLFVPWRNDLPGACKFVIDAKLIESRCKRMVIILSNNYLKSSACDFQVKFAHALSPGARSKKLIPVLIEPINEIPQILRHVTLCDYTKMDLQIWFWHRLANAIKQPLDPQSSGFGQSTPSSMSPPMSLTSSMSSVDSGFADSHSIPDITMEMSDHSHVKIDWEEISCDELNDCVNTSQELSVSKSTESVTESNNHVTIATSMPHEELARSSKPRKVKSNTSILGRIKTKLHSKNSSHV